LNLERNWVIVRVMIRDEIKKLIEKAIEKEFGKTEIPEIEIEKPENKEFGDYSSNIALRLAKVVKKKPMEVAKQLISNFSRFGRDPVTAGQFLPPRAESRRGGTISNFFDEVKIAEPGFINFYLSKEYLQKQLGEILKKGEKFGPPKFSERKFRRVNIEFISANPTGPLTLGNGRGGFCGDVLANVLKKAGYKLTREYYINDVGEQIKKLGHSVLGDKEAVYRGKYIEVLRKRIKGDNPGEVGEETAEIILEEMIKPTVKDEMKINFDVWFSEKSLHKNKEVDKVLTFLKRKKLAYEKDGALWFKSTQFGDDKDRVLIKADGEKTYLASDIAYLKNKFERGFDKLIYIWGADHYGYIGRIKATGQALGYEPEKIAFIIMQLVRLMEAGKEVRMSKRTGTFVTLEELIDEVGLDVARFFFLMRSPDSHMNFDLDLAKEQSEKNPVFYIQYAFARICSILRKARIKTKKQKLSNLTIVRLLNDISELTLLKELIRFPEIIEDTAKDYQVQRLPNYALELVTAFHKFYEECRVISDDKTLTQARLSLVLATKIILKNTLDLMGISAPEKM